MANSFQDPGSQQTDTSVSNKPKKHTIIPRTWPQHHTSSNTNFSAQNQNQTPTASSTTSSAITQYSNTTHHHHNNTNNLPTPMARWLAESQQETPYNTIHSVENSAHPGQNSHLHGGERMERGNGWNERSAEDNWSMERNEQSERWA